MARGRLSGLVTGCLVATAFGLVFVIVNCAGLPRPWPVLVRVAGTAAAVVLLVATFRVARVATDPVAPGGPGFAGRGFSMIVAVEGLALFGGLAVLGRVLHHADLGVAWVAVVVGVHFFALARLWRMRMYHVLGAVMTALGVAGFVLAAAGVPAAMVAVVSGVGSGVALFATVGAALRAAVRPAPVASVEG